jgi:phage gpG-like protein
VSESVEVIGDERLRSTLNGAADKLDDLQAAHETAGRVLLTRARGAAPVLTGRLAGSLVLDASGGEAVVSSELVYAAVIHNGWPAHNIRANPFLSTTLDESVELITPPYLDEIETVLATVKGA